ncbi:GNAT family N-acetyltransferase [Paenibacillus allorhizosphaerae]|uniref:Acetyltransferase n=1 Tax=Paenibacillus allorhizosphaerae TaxID=2849866 RepID=A0ABN7TJA8_9BACL|nr:GNAT family N-acetyltransferase [Paenibacillus allorhizosphaerae]CAG7637192.1 Acetyltransferase [Paenibacillus allorhizosphaerae]
MNKEARILCEFEGIALDNQIIVEQLESIGERLAELAELLMLVVEDGASIGFLPPLKYPDAAEYWGTVLSPNVVLFAATINKKIVGSVQLHLSSKQNGAHRAEIAKLMAHPHYRRRGIGRTLMSMAEERAKQEGRSLLVLDTREGDPSNRLYASIGFIEAGRIPNYARSANGELHATIFYYKELL